MPSPGHPAAAPLTAELVLLAARDAVVAADPADVVPATRVGIVSMVATHGLLRCNRL